MANSVFLFPGSFQIGGGLTIGGNFLFTPDNTYDIGATGARPRDILLGRNLLLNSTSEINWETRSKIVSPSDGVFTLLNQLGNNFSRIQLGGTTNAFPSLKRSGASIHVKLADDSSYTQLIADELYAISNLRSDLMDIGRAVGAGISTGLLNNVRRAAHYFSVNYTLFTAAAVTSEFTIANLPSKTRIAAIVVDTVTPYAGLAGTITLMVGYGATPNELIVAHDVKTGVITKGLADADLGVGLTRATAIQGGVVPSWSAVTAIKVRITSGAGNVGNGAVTNLTAGITNYHIFTERMI